VDAEHEVRELLERWAGSVAAMDRDGLVAEHAGDVVMFDVAAPPQVRGLEDYRRQWEPFFDAQGAGTFRFDELTVVAGDDVAWAFGVIVCGTTDPATHFPVRLTVGLRREDRRWVVAHEHHSALPG
jgi:ketosteroid isomerase-like protein